MTDAGHVNQAATGSELAAELRRNVHAADPSALLMCLIEITGDMSYLEEFGPRLIHPPKQKVRGLTPRAELPAEDLERLVDLLVGALDKPPADDRPSGDDAKMTKLLHYLTGYDVPTEYAPMIAEQGALRAPAQVVARTKSAPADFTVAVLGAGMTGLSAGIRLAEQGVRYRIFERRDEVGGTWNIHRYPGVAVDTPSLYYSLTHKLKDWSRFFPTGAEYQDYLVELADEFGLRDNITFGADVTALHWNDERQVWTVHYRRDGITETFEANVVVTGLGFLNDPKYPSFPGQDTFQGESFHTGEWPDGIDLTGKRVGMIGCGATGVQIADAVVSQVAELTIFQRQPHWILPDLIGKAEVPDPERWLVANLPYYNEWIRSKTFWLAADVINYPRVRVDAEWMRTHPLSISEANDATLQLCLAHIRDNFGTDTELAKKMTPDFPPNGKRNVRDPGNYYPSIARGDIEIEDTAISRAVPTGIELSDGRVVELDVLIYATGFSLNFLSDIEIVGRDGRKLADEWGDNTPRGYIGALVHGFPNLFVTSGPNSAVGHGGAHNFQTDACTQYLTESLQVLFENDARSIEVTREAQDAYVARIDECLAGSIWGLNLSANTYYKNDTGRTILPSPFPLLEDWTLHRTPVLGDVVLR